MSLFQPYSYSGPASVPRHLADTSGPVAYTATLAAGFAAGGLLLLSRRTVRLGAGVLAGTAMVFAAQLVSTTADFLRSTEPGTDLFYGPGPGYWLNLISAALFTAATAATTTRMARAGALRFRETRLARPWMLTGLLVTVLWCAGAWMSWLRTTVTQEIDGQTVTQTLWECCSLSTASGQTVAQDAVCAAVTVLLVVVSSRLSSASVASGMLFGLAFGHAGPVASVLFASPPTLKELAVWWGVNVQDLLQDQTILGTEPQAGMWPAVAAVAGITGLAAARIRSAARAR
ncbi:hypothetical protein [Streptomyces xanthophaeus]|uniref:hypothetical protein n=1 Tax=Streptomyces xanthophaeus TaxID=67385 RepID=UPI0036536BFC